MALRYRSTIEARLTAATLQAFAGIDDKMTADLFALYRKLAERRSGDEWVPVDQDMSLLDLMSLVVGVASGLTLRFDVSPAEGTPMNPTARENNDSGAQGSHRPRVMVYGVGYYGMAAVRILASKGWPIVAAVNRAGPKVGQDLGRLAGLDRDLGVVVQDCETADYAALGADVALVVQTERLALNLAAYRRLLGAGINVICHGSESYYPQGADPALAENIDALAKRNGVTFTGTGIWDFSRIWSGILIAGPCTELRSLAHRSLTDAELANERMMRAYGVDMTQAEFKERVTDVPGQLGELYKGIPAHVMHALGFTITNVTERRDPVLSDRPVWCRTLNRLLDPGTSLGLRIVASVETAEGPTATAHIELRILNEGEAEHMMWTVDGRPPSKIRVDRADGVHTSAACMVNRIPDVFAAPPGVKLISQLGPLRPSIS